MMDIFNLCKSFTFCNLNKKIKPLKDPLLKNELNKDIISNNSSSNGRMQNEKSNIFCFASLYIFKKENIIKDSLDSPQIELQSPINQKMEDSKLQIELKKSNNTFLLEFLDKNPINETSINETSINETSNISENNRITESCNCKKIKKQPIIIYNNKEMIKPLNYFKRFGEPLNVFIEKLPPINEESETIFIRVNYSSYFEEDIPT